MVMVGLVCAANYINPILYVCSKGQTDNTNPNPVICKPEGITHSKEIYFIQIITHFQFTNPEI